MSSHLRQRFQQRKLVFSGAGFPASAPSSSAPSTNLLTPPLTSLSRSTSGASGGASPAPSPGLGAPSGDAPGSAFAACGGRPPQAPARSEARHSAWGADRGHEGDRRDDREGDRWASDRGGAAAPPAYGDRPEAGRGAAGDTGAREGSESRDRGRGGEEGRDAFYAREGDRSSAFASSSRGHYDGADARRLKRGRREEDEHRSSSSRSAYPAHDARRRHDDTSSLAAPNGHPQKPQDSYGRGPSAASSSNTSGGRPAAFRGPGDSAAVLSAAPHQGVGPGATRTLGAGRSGALETGVCSARQATGVRGPAPALPPLPQDLPLDHASVASPAGGKLPSSMEELLPFILRALLHHPTVSPSIRRAEAVPGAPQETVTCLTRTAECHIELNAFAAHLKQLSRAAAAGGRGVSSLASQRLFRPEAVLRVLQFAAYSAAQEEGAEGKNGQGAESSPGASAPPVLGALHPFPYPLLSLSSLSSLTVIKALFPLRICAVLFTLHQQSQQQALASASSSASAPANGGAASGPPQQAAAAAPTPRHGIPPVREVPPAGPSPSPSGPARASPARASAPASAASPPRFPPFCGGGSAHPTALGSSAVGPSGGGAAPGAGAGAPKPPPPPPPAFDDKKGGTGGDKDAHAELQEDLEKLLSVPTALKQRDLDSGSELTSLLSAPTARQQMIIHSFKNKGGSALREICPFGSRLECCRARNAYKPCTKVHFRRIVLAHTDISLGDCSYLDTCRHIETCRYVHYEVDDASKGDVLKKMQGDAADPYAIGTISAGARTEYPAQWIRCDIRTFDFSIFRKLIRVVMADPPWDIHMDLPYGTMTDQEMRNLRVDLIQEEGLLFLWVTGRAMELARECLELWGYTRVEEILWVKTNQLQRIIRTGRTGHWLNHSKEHCLVAVKGNAAFNRNIDCDVIVSEVRETSRKPDEIYRIIERMAPDSLKVELFGRMHNVRNNWITLGNQLKGVKLEHPLLLERYNAFAENAGLPRAEPPSASAGAETEDNEANEGEKSEETPSPEAVQG
ncbi:putative methyltransferase MTA70 [Besnoitia besnoiti]|uniref:Putative methyltransferase MTA70 n=1 Tax=Besnoitia besnoiti TaxID=94643 RepID=A0A2A9MM34_BESBE|nr:putative methyltransferase MTA70 [Besnoitia besnoiti]PFH37441.1 putative methyltransferase MTA70 [Besnoitia besnoiti]